MKNKLFLVFLLSTALSAMTAGATPIGIGGLVSRSQYAAITGSQGSNPTNDLAFLEYQISSNTQDAFNVPDWDLQISSNLTFSGSPTSYTAGLGDEYVVIHFGGKGGGYYQAYYLGGAGGTITAPSGVGGISSARSVPDGGSTVMLLGAALSAIAVARRKFGV